MAWFEVADPALGTDLSVDSREIDSGEEILERMSHLIECEGALQLRIAELLYAIESGDRRKTGVTSFRAYVKEFTNLDRSWATKLKNFAAPGLTIVKVAVCRNWIPISMAVEAPRDMTPEEEDAWVQGVRTGEIRRQTKSAHKARVDIDDPVDAAVLHEARKLARTMVGGNCSDEMADRHMRKEWRNRSDGKEIVRRAMEPRDPPPPLEPVDWSTAIDPAAPILGPREVPKDEMDARRILQRLLRDREMRTIEIGQRFQEVRDRKLYRLWGFDTMEAMVKKCFRVSIKTLQNYRDRARDLSIYPELVQALESGMSGRRVQLVYEVATEDNVARWLEVAKRTTVAELERAVAWAHETVRDFALESYEWAMSKTKSAHHWVALRAARRPLRPPKRIEGVHPDQMEAARWYLANVKLPKQHGFEEVKEREAWTCECPRCYTTTITCESHHKKWRSRGGTEDKENGASVCRCCHHGGIHANEIVRLEVDEHGRDVWSFADGVDVVVF
jgi:hypothetical protein